MSGYVITGNLSKEQRNIGGDMPGDLVFGTPGQPGPPGRTPVKGIDYYTEADKQEMVSMVLAAMPVWEGGSY